MFRVRGGSADAREGAYPPYGTMVLTMLASRDSKPA
jgi:hypothetical protein